MSPAKLTVTLSTTVRVRHQGACMCGCECAYTLVHSARCRSTAEWLRSGRLVPSVSGLVPTLSLPTHFAFIFAPPSLPDGVLGFGVRIRVEVAPVAELWTAFTSARR